LLLVYLNYIVISDICYVMNDKIKNNQINDLIIERN